MDANPKIDTLSFLVIDDEAFIRNLLSRLLLRMGAYRVSLVANGVEALQHLDATSPAPDVLLIDLSMPEMGGAELIRQLAARGYKGAIILVSGADRETLVVAEGMARYRDVNVLGYLTKPPTPEALGKLLEKLG